MLNALILTLVLNKIVTDEEADILHIKLSSQLQPITWQLMKKQVEEILGRNL